MATNLLSLATNSIKLRSSATCRVSEIKCDENGLYRKRHTHEFVSIRLLMVGCYLYKSNVLLKDLQHTCTRKQSQSVITFVVIVRPVFKDALCYFIRNAFVRFASAFVSLFAALATLSG